MRRKDGRVVFFGDGYAIKQIPYASTRVSILPFEIFRTVKVAKFSMNWVSLTSYLER